MLKNSTGIPSLRLETASLILLPHRCKCQSGQASISDKHKPPAHGAGLNIQCPGGKSQSPWKMVKTHSTLKQGASTLSLTEPSTSFLFYLPRMLNRKGNRPGSYLQPSQVNRGSPELSHLQGGKGRCCQEGQHKLSMKTCSRFCQVAFLKGSLYWILSQLLAPRRADISLHLLPWGPRQNWKKAMDSYHRECQKPWATLFMISRQHLEIQKVWLKVPTKTRSKHPCWLLDSLFRGCLIL